MWQRGGGGNVMSQRSECGLASPRSISNGVAPIVLTPSMPAEQAPPRVRGFWA